VLEITTGVECNFHSLVVEVQDEFISNGLFSRESAIDDLPTFSEELAAARALPRESVIEGEQLLASKVIIRSGSGREIEMKMLCVSVASALDKTTSVIDEMAISGPHKKMDVRHHQLHLVISL